MSLGERDGCSAVGRERVEVVPGVGDLGAFVDLEAHAEEDVLDLALHLGQQVQASAREGVAGQRDVERGCRGQPLELFPLDRLATRVDCGLEPGADPVQEHAALPIAHAAQGLREVALPAEVANSRVVEPAASAAAATVCSASVRYCSQSTVSDSPSSDLVPDGTTRRQAPARRKDRPRASARPRRAGAG